MPKGKPSRNTPADKRLKANKTKSKGQPFGGKKAAPFKAKGKR